MVSSVHMVFYWERLIGLVIVHLVSAEKGEMVKNERLMWKKRRDQKSARRRCYDSNTTGRSESFLRASCKPVQRPSLLAMTREQQVSTPISGR